MTGRTRPGNTELPRYSSRFHQQPFPLPFCSHLPLDVSSTCISYAHGQFVARTLMRQAKGNGTPSPNEHGSPRSAPWARTEVPGRKREQLNDFANCFTMRPPFPNHSDRVTPVQQAPVLSSPSYVSIIPLRKWHISPKSSTLARKGRERKKKRKREGGKEGKRQRDRRRKERKKCLFLGQDECKTQNV